MARHRRGGVAGLISAGLLLFPTLPGARAADDIVVGATVRRQNV